MVASSGFVDEAPGFPLFYPKGIVLRNNLENFWREQDSAWAVHRLDGIRLFVDFCKVHIVLIMVPMAGYGTSFPKKAELEEHLYKLEEAKRRDHRKLGQELQLFTFVDEAPGFPLFYPKGIVLNRKFYKHCQSI